MMATVPHVTSGLGLRKFQADGFLLTRVYITRNALHWFLLPELRHTVLIRRKPFQRSAASFGRRSGRHSEQQFFKSHLISCTI
jgi:hypothetical protein